MLTQDEVVAEAVALLDDVGLSRGGRGSPTAARALFAAQVAHRDAPLVVAGNRPAPESLERNEAMLAALVEHSRMSPADAITVIFSLGQYVIGSAIEWQSEARRAEKQRGASSASAATTRIRDEPENFPTLRAAFLGMAARGNSAAFDTRLTLFVDGLRARYGD